MSTAPAKSVLIVEDNALNAKLARDVLVAKGYAVRVAGSGEEGLRLACEEVPNLVLMDIQLPGIDGIEALRQLRAHPATAHVPVVAFTASVTSGERSRVNAAGFDGFLSKPINLKEFLATVQGLRRSDDA
jgi:two-component system cell cycle response regulator DivK